MELYLTPPCASSWANFMQLSPPCLWSSFLGLATSISGAVPGLFFVFAFQLSSDICRVVGFSFWSLFRCLLFRKASWVAQPHQCFFLCTPLRRRCPVTWVTFLCTVCFLNFCIFLCSFIQCVSPLLESKTYGGETCLSSFSSFLP